MLPCLRFIAGDVWTSDIYELVDALGVAMPFWMVVIAELYTGAVDSEPESSL